MSNTSTIRNSHFLKFMMKSCLNGQSFFRIQDFNNHRRSFKVSVFTQLFMVTQDICERPSPTHLREYLLQTFCSAIFSVLVKVGQWGLKTFICKMSYVQM